MSGGPTTVCVAGANGAAVDRALDADVVVRDVDSVVATRAAVADASVDCVLAGSDLQDGSPVDALRSVREVAPWTPVVLWPDEIDPAEATAAVRHDATEYLPDADVETVAERVEETFDDALPVPDAALDVLTKGIPDTVVTLDDSGTVVFASDAVEDVFGYDPDELTGRQFAEIVPERLRDDYHGTFADRTDERTLDRDRVELSAVDADGEEFPVAISFRAFELGGRRYVSGTVRDVSDRRRRERALAALNESTRQLMAAEDADAVTDLAVETAKDVLGMPINSIHLLDEESELLEPAASTDGVEDVLGDPPALGLDDSLAGSTFRHGEPVLYGNLDEQPGRHNPDTPLESELLLPLGDHGVLIVADTEVDAFDEVDASLARILAANVETALSRAAREQELLRYRAVIENVRDLLFALDDDGRITLATDPLADLLGYDPDELEGKRLETVLSGDGSREGGSPVGDRFDGEASDATSYETELEPADGEPIPVEIELSPLDGWRTFDGLVGVVRDRSEIERTREELETARERFTYLFEHIPDAVVQVEFVDGDPVVRSVNPAFEDVFGYDPGEVVGSSLNEYVLTDERYDSANDLDDSAIDGEETTERIRRKTATGVRDFLFRGVPYRTGGDTVRAFGIYTDVTEQTERERRLGVLTNVLRHNLRTEMNLVLAHADAILESDPDGQVAALAEQLQENAEAVVELGETARDLEALIERTWGTDSSIDLVPLVEDVTDDLAEQYPAATVRTDLPGSATVVGDGTLRQALEELVENAVEHGSTDPGSQAQEDAVGREASDEPSVADAPEDAAVHGGEGVTVEVTVDRVSDEWVELRVADDGPGIPTFERELLAGEREVTQLEHGSGLGLWIARWTVESLDGTLTLLDRDPHGTVARVRLRRA